MEKNRKEPLHKGVARVPVVMQLEALECGAACLAMVLAYYGKWVPLEQVRAACGVSRDGAKASNLRTAAKSYGLDAKGYRYEPEELQEKGTFPCIIHWNFNHFVVLDGFKGGKAYLNDPAGGTYAVSMETFDESFTGICLMFEPTEAFEPGGKPKSVFTFARERMKGAGTAFAFGVVTLVISSLLNLIRQVFPRVFMDRLLTWENPDWVVPFFLLLSAITVLQLMVKWIRTVCFYRINGILDVVGSATFMWHVLNLPMEFFSQRMAGDIQQRQEANADVAKDILSTFAPLVIDGALTVFYLVVMVRYSPLLALIGVASIFINLTLSQFIARKRANITRVRKNSSGKLAGATVAGIEMIETIKASGAENGYFEKWAGYQASANTQEVKTVRLDRMLGTIPALVGTLTDILVLILGVYLVINGQFTVGMIMAFQGLLSSFKAPAMTLISAGETLQEMRTDMERIEDVMKYPAETHYEETAEDGIYDKLSGCIEMKHVTFGYSRLGEPLIEDFNLTLKPGSRVAFVGSSGCGKSTLSKLLSGLYKPWSGEILFDGKPIDQIDRSVFTSSLAVVDQDIIMFEDTIANNIRMWDSSIEDFEMIMAARDAQVHEDIMQRVGGYQYRITEGGKDFSGGQRQRMEIARVLAQDPTIIIMDEATSALDAKTEYDVVKSIQDRGITCIVVAHRLSTIRDCDEIIVMHYGRVVERGTHEELYAKGGAYAQLVSNE